jgi:prepilin-type N-terminal cleavage/methylation domain-containing protein
MSRRARAEGGFTVVELLVAMVVLGVVAVGAMTLIEVVMRQGRGVVDRTEAAQRGRLVLDQMTREIRSQVCLNATTEGLVAAAPNSLTFYADLSAGDRPTTKRTLAYESPSKRIVEYVYKPDGTTVASKTVLLQNVVPAVDPNADVSTKPKPTLFNYWAYQEASPGELEWLGDSFATSQVGRIAVVSVSIGVFPHAGSNTKAMTALNDQVVLRNADPNATNNDPTCQ